MKLHLSVFSCITSKLVVHFFPHSCVNGLLKGFGAKSPVIAGLVLSRHFHLIYQLRYAREIIRQLQMPTSLRKRVQMREHASPGQWERWVLCCATVRVSRAQFILGVTENAPTCSCDAVYRICKGFLCAEISGEIWQPASMPLCDLFHCRIAARAWICVMEVKRICIEIKPGPGF